jgi:hypothetical protein
MATKVCNLLVFIGGRTVCYPQYNSGMKQEELSQEYDRRMHALKVKEDEQKEDRKIVYERPFSAEADSARERMDERVPEIERLKTEFFTLGSHH